MIIAVEPKDRIPKHIGTQSARPIRSLHHCKDCLRGVISQTSKCLELKWTCMHTFYAIQVHPDCTAHLSSSACLSGRKGSQAPPAGSMVCAGERVCLMQASSSPYLSSVYVYICVRACTCVYACMSECLNRWRNRCMFVCLCVWMYVCMYVGR